MVIQTERDENENEKFRIRAAAVLAAFCLLLNSCATWAEGEEDSWHITRNIDNESAVVSGDVKDTVFNTYAVAVYVNSNQGKPITATLQGDLFTDAKTDSLDHQACTGLGVEVSGKGSEARVTAEKKITALNAWVDTEPWNLDTAGVDISVGDSGKAVVILKDDVYARSAESEEAGYTWTAGVSAYNRGGDLTLESEGSITAEDHHDYGVALNFHLEPPEESDAVPASSFAFIDGDLSGTTLGIRANNNLPDGQMEILVNGTVSGEDCISWEGENRDQILFTLWKANPEKKIVRADMDTTEEDAAREEKAIRYILLTDSATASVPTPDTEVYHGFHIAKAGERVSVLASAPTGYEVSAVYALPGKKLPLEKGSDGAWILTVPNGGGVELSADLKKAEPAPVPKTGDGATPVLWIGLVLLGLTGLCAAVFRKA